jgi:PAS domain-containing protein
MLRALRGESVQFERSIPRPDGGGFFHSLAHYLPDLRDGVVQGFFVLVHDVTELVEAKQQLSANLTMFNEIADAIPYGLAVYDEAQAMRLHNRALVKNLALPEELLDRPGLCFSDLIRFRYERGDYRSDLPLVAVLEKLNAHMHRADLVQGQCQQVEGAHIEVRSVPLSNGWRAVTYMDITQRVHMEERLRENYELMLAAIDSVEEAFVMYDADDRMVYCNGRYK